MFSQIETSPGLLGLKHVKSITAGCQLTTVRHRPCGQLVAAGGYDGKVHLWDLASRESPELAPLCGHDGWVQALAYRTDGRLFTADTWGRICCWSHPSRSHLLWEVRKAHEGWVRDLAISPDGATLASCGADRSVRLCAPTTDGPSMSSLTPTTSLASRFIRAESTSSRATSKESFATGS